MKSKFQQAPEAMRRTYHDLPPDSRRAVIELVNARLAVTIDLRLQAKQAHWNVRGPRFLSLHELFDQVADAGTRFQDILGERVAQLGGFAAGTVEAVQAGSTLASYPLALTWEQDHVRCIAEALSRLARSARAGVSEAQQLGDEATADILLEITRETDKLMWFVEAHLEEREQAESLEASDGEQEAARRGDGGQPAAP